jgi:hypothetical protein
MQVIRSNQPIQIKHLKRQPGDDGRLTYHGVIGADIQCLLAKGCLNWLPRAVETIAT